MSTPLTTSLPNLQAGGQLGKYVILSELGRGGMAVVFKAHQPDLDRLVAIKVLFGVALHSRFIDRFQAEAKSVAKMNHPNVIKIHEVGEQKGIYYLVMEYIEGMDMLSYLHEKKPSFNEVVDIVRQIAEALSYCHKQGIIHRDLKPTNILMQGSTPIVIDFGLAKALDPDSAATLTLSGEVVGSPAYMSPEQAMGQSVGILSDICSLGIIMYELISFKNPYLDPRSLHQTALNAIQADPVPLRYLTPWLHVDFSAIVGMCMTRETRDRYQSMDIILKDIFSFQNGLPVMAKPPGALDLTWRFIKANPILYLGAAFLLIFAFMMIAFISMQKESKKAPWGLVMEEYFNRPGSGMQFMSYDNVNGAWKPSNSWKVTRGRLEAFSTGFSYAVSNHELFGDLKIEFMVQGLNGSNNDFNVFLFGNTPAESFRFSLGEWGNSVANIEHGKMRKYAFDTNPIKLNGGVAYKITIEKEGNSLSLKVNDRPLVHRYYTLPIAVDRNSKFGFYTWNSSLAIDDIRIYKKAVALSASPTVVADAYLEEGFIRNSIPAYKHVIETYPKKSISHEAHLKLGKCFMVQKNYKDALIHLTFAASNSKDPLLLAEALFQLAQCNFGLGRSAAAYEKLKLLSMAYPESEYNSILTQARIESIYQCLNQSEPESCAGMMIDEFRFLIQYQDPRRHVFGMHYVELVDIFRRLGCTSPVQHSLGLNAYFSENDEISFALGLQHALYFAGKKDLTRAKQIIAELERRQRNNVQIGSRLLLLGQFAFLESDYSLAASQFEKTYRDFFSIHGLPFKAIVYSLAISNVAKVPVLRVEKKLYTNDAISRKERMQLAYLAERIPEDYARRGIIPERPPEKLEDILVDFLKIESLDGVAKGAAFLLAAIRRTPTDTFEHLYLSHLHKGVLARK